MKTRYLAATAAAALLFGALVPASAASAADTPIQGAVYGDEAAVLADIPVGWIDADDSSNFFETASDEDGRYSFSVPEDVESYYLYANLVQSGNGGATVSDPDYTGSFLGKDGARGAISQLVAPFDGPTSAEHDFPLTRSGAISGTSTIYANSTLSLETLGSTFVAHAFVDGEGAFRFDGLVPGDYRISAQGTGLYTDYTSPTITVSSGATADVSLAPAKGATISGVVKNGSKKLAGISVYIGSDSDYAYTTTNSSGAYSAKGLRPGNYSVSFSSFSTSPSKSYATKTVSVKSVKSNTTRTVNASLASAGIYKGKVTMTKGADFYQVTVFNSSKRAVGFGYGQSSKSTFTVTGLASGKYTAYITDGKLKNYASKSFSIKAGKSTSAGTVKLSKKTVTLSGKVSGASGGFVTAYSAKLTGGGSVISSSGKYSIKGLIPGTYSVAVDANGAATKTTTVKVSKSTTKNLSKGPALGKVTATLSIQGRAVSGYVSFRSKSDEIYADFADGALSGRGSAGTYKARSFELDTELPGLTPYWYSVPVEAKSFVLKSGKTTALGAIEPVLNGYVVPQP